MDSQPWGHVVNVRGESVSFTAPTGPRERTTGATTMSRGFDRPKGGFAHITDSAHNQDHDWSRRTGNRSGGFVPSPSRLASDAHVPGVTPVAADSQRSRPVSGGDPHQAAYGVLKVPNRSRSVRPVAPRRIRQ